MKKLGMLIVVLVCCQAAVWAQSGRPSAKERLDRRMEVLDSALNLTVDQQERIRTILDEAVPTMQKLHRSGVGRDSIKAYREALHERIAAELDAGQRQKFDAMKDRFSNRSKGRRFKGRDDSGPQGAGPDSMRKELHQLMQARRATFEQVLSEEHKALISTVREEVKALRPEPGQRDSMGRADRLRLTADRLDVLERLDPIIQEHKQMLDSLVMPPKGMAPAQQGPPDGRQLGDRSRKAGKQNEKEQKPYYRFLLISPKE